MPSTSTSQVQLSQTQAAVVAMPYYCGGNVGLSFPNSESFFSVEIGGRRYDWSITETILRIQDFSEAAQAQIGHDLEAHAKYSKIDNWFSCAVVGGAA